MAVGLRAGNPACACQGKQSKNIMRYFDSFSCILYFAFLSGYLLLLWILRAFLGTLCVAYINYHGILIMLYHVMLSLSISSLCYFMLYYHYYVILLYAYIDYHVGSAVKKSVGKNH